MSRVIHFEIPADDPKRAVSFYEKVFDWKIEEWEGGDYWLVTTGPDEEPGINGAIMPKKPGNDVVRNGISVSDIDAYMKKVEMEGGKILTEKIPIQGIGDWVLFQDTEGNTSSLLQPSPESMERYLASKK